MILRSSFSELSFCATISPSPGGLFLLGGRLEGRWYWAGEGGSSVNDRHSPVCERGRTPPPVALASLVPKV